MGIIGDIGSYVFSFMEFLVGLVVKLVVDNFIVMLKCFVVDGFVYGESVEFKGDEDWVEIINFDGINLMV